MDEIKPDTSLYTELPNKLRAFAAIMESGCSIEVKFDRDGGWVSATSANTETRLTSLVIRNNDYRIKPKPRELWAVYDGEGKYCTASPRDIYDPARWDANYPGKAPHVIVRFVEQPE